MKKKNIFVRFFCCIGRGINNFFCYLTYLLFYIFAKPITKCKVKGKENVNPNDEARVFTSNHYEIFGPIAMYLNFPYKFRPWIIDKMMEPEKVKQQMSLSVYNNFKGIPMWLKRIFVSAMKNVVVFVMKHAKGISVSRENPRNIAKTMKESVETLEKGSSIVIFPELNYTSDGVTKFQMGFEHLGKYYYQKTGKKISFYPVFVSELGKTIFIGKPILFNPENEPNEEKFRIVNYLFSETVKLYEENELNNPKIQAKRLKLQKKAEKKKLKKTKKRKINKI